MKKRAQSIERQVLVFTVATCGAVLLTVGGILFYHHLAQTRERLGKSLATTAQIIAANASVSLAFRNESEAADILAALKNDPLVVSAALYDQTGRRFVTYGEAPEIAPPLAGRGLGYDIAQIPVVYRSDNYGQLLIMTDNRSELHRTALTWAVVYLAALIVVGLLAAALAARFRRAVAAPLVELARTAADVAARRDYSVRARAGGTAEIDALASMINTMLAEVGRRDAELARQLTALNKEIRERELAEASLRQNQRELLRLSHAAGMAEVAAGVLHNIGNALNSINVSTELLSTQLHARALASARALRDFFQAPPPKAAPVFSSHPDGADVQAFAGSVSAHIASQLDHAEREFSSLRTGVAHLKDIVARQQTLAKSPRHRETFDIRDAIREALLIDKTEDHLPSGALILDAPEAPPALVYADRNSVVQILINLLANARAAIQTAAPASPRLEVRVGAPHGNHLSITVTDNGVGIAREQLFSIFNYGFTTKAGGHGFGLHNSANTARLLGGSLSVHSQGSGLGATFTLSLPSHPPASSVHDA